ncbi:MAG: acylphosphatase [Dehalococcoidales bacterium]|nr:acylphosphatase [Dehalococcoidales bacterium]
MVEQASLHATVRGRVQGVFFRASVEEQAIQLGLSGYVRNRPGNVVEVIAEGDKANLEKLVEYLEVGPPAASVKEVNTTWGEFTGGFSSFRVR